MKNLIYLKVVLVLVLYSCTTSTTEQTNSDSEESISYTSLKQLLDTNQAIDDRYLIDEAKSGIIGVLIFHTIVLESDDFIMVNSGNESTMPKNYYLTTFSKKNGNMVSYLPLGAEAEAAEPAKVVFDSSNQFYTVEYSYELLVDEESGAYMEGNLLDSIINQYKISNEGVIGKLSNSKLGGPIAYFNKLPASLGEKISTSADIEEIKGWNFTVHNVADITTIICASSTNEEKILFSWDANDKKFKPFTLQPEVSKNTLLSQISFTMYGSKQSKSVSVFSTDINKLNVPNVTNFPFENSTDVRVANDSLYITTATGVLTFLNTSNSTGGGEGEALDYYIYIQHVGTDYVVLAKLGYGDARTLLINLATGQPWLLPENGEMQNFQFSPNLLYMAITMDGGGVDGNYDPNVKLMLYKLEEEGPALILKTSLGPIGHSTGLKWVSNHEFFIYTYCQEYSIIIDQPYRTVRDPELIDALRDAIKNEDLAKVTRLMEQGVDANYSLNPWPYPPIVEACEVGNLTILKELIKYGTDPKLGYDDEAYNTNYPVEFAIRKGHLEVVKYLFSIGARSELLNVEDEAMYAFLQGQGLDTNNSQKLSAAFNMGDFAQCRELLNNGAIIEYDLGWAANTVEKFNFLKEYDYDFTQLNENQVEYWPDNRSMLGGLVEDVFLLFLQAGVRPSPTSLIFMFNEWQQVNFDLALKYLINNYDDFNINDSFVYENLDIENIFHYYNGINNTTLLSMAVAANNTRAIETLLANGADSTIKDTHGKLALDYSSDENREAIGKLVKE